MDAVKGMMSGGGSGGDVRAFATLSCIMRSALSGQFCAFMHFFQKVALELAAAMH